MAVETVTTLDGFDALAASTRDSLLDFRGPPLPDG